MKKLALISLIASTIIATTGSGCKTNPSNESFDSNTQSNNPLSGINKTTGMIGGGVLGGLLGNQVGSGSGKTLATIAEVLGGAYLGGELTGNDIQKQSQPTTQRDIPEYTATPIKMASNDSQVNKYCHKKVSYDKTVNMDVDVAYVRFKRAFDYKTRQEKLIEAGLDPNCTDDLMCRFDQGFKHIVQPGISYKMSDQVHLDTGYYLGWLTIELEKAGKNKTIIFVQYCNGGSEGFENKDIKVIDNKIKKINL